jgi:bifunctional non-homologous end joining protein LigD
MVVRRRRSVASLHSPRPGVALRIDGRYPWTNRFFPMPAKRRPSSARTPTAGELPGAVAAPLPRTFSPQLATLVKAPPTGTAWSYEAKLDGYRIVVHVEGGKARLVTRGGHDWSAKMPRLASELARLPLQSGWLDGEIVVLDAAGVPDFNALQNAMDAAQGAAVLYFAFDLPYADGFDLRRVPLHARRALLRQLIGRAPSEHVRVSEDFPSDGAAMLKAACAMGLEGIIAKRRDAPYVCARSTTWLKIKCSARQEFVVVGFVDRTNSKSHIGSLLLGYYEGRALRYAGSVGTGWDTRTSADLHQRLAKIEVDAPALDAADVKPGRWSKRRSGNERWVKPQLVVEVQFTEWTPDGHVRHPSFQGIRTDKAARSVVREKPAA